MGRFLGWIAPVWAVIVSAYLLFGPTYGTLRESGAADQPGTEARGEPTVDVESAVGREGWAISFAFIIPVVLSTIPLFGRREQLRRLMSCAATTFLALFCIMASASIGLYYIPSLIALVLECSVPFVRRSETGAGRVVG